MECPPALKTTVFACVTAAATVFLLTRLLIHWASRLVSWATADSALAVAGRNRRVCIWRTLRILFCCVQPGASRLAVLQPVLLLLSLILALVVIAAVPLKAMGSMGFALWPSCLPQLRILFLPPPGIPVLFLLILNEMFINIPGMYLVAATYTPCIRGAIRYYMYRHARVCSRSPAYCTFLCRRLLIARCAGV